MCHVLTSGVFEGIGVRFSIVLDRRRSCNSWDQFRDCALLIAFFDLLYIQEIWTDAGNWVEIFWNCLVLTGIYQVNSHI